MKRARISIAVLRGLRSLAALARTEVASGADWLDADERRELRLALKWIDLMTKGTRPAATEREQ